MSEDRMIAVMCALSAVWGLAIGAGIMFAIFS